MTDLGLNRVLEMSLPPAQSHRQPIRWYPGPLFRQVAPPVALFALIVLAYGTRIADLGFYWDDWPNVWFFAVRGNAGIIDAFAQDRPFLSAIYILCMNLLGQSPLAWQVFGLFARWLCAVGFGWAFLALWPRQRFQVFAATALFALYPGFTQQWISVIYGQAFLLYAALFFSLGLTWRQARIPAVGRGQALGWAFAAWVFSGFHIFSTEYFFGLELLRPLGLWLILSSVQDRLPLRQRLLRVLRL